MTDQNYTIAKIIGEPKQYEDKTRFAFTTNETGETIHSMFTKFPNNIKPGVQIYGHLEKQEKEGKTYSNFFFGKDNPNKKGGMTEADKALLQKIYQEAYAARQEIVIVRQLLQENGSIKAAPQVAKGVEYPESNGPTAFDDDPADDPDFDPFGGM